MMIPLRITRSTFYAGLLFSFLTPLVIHFASLELSSQTAANFFMNVPGIRSVADESHLATSIAIGMGTAMILAFLIPILFFFTSINMTVELKLRLNARSGIRKSLFIPMGIILIFMPFFPIDGGKPLLSAAFFSAVQNNIFMAGLFCSGLCLYTSGISIALILLTMKRINDHA